MDSERSSLSARTVRQAALQDAMLGLEKAFAVARAAVVAAAADNTSPEQKKLEFLQEAVEAFRQEGNAILDSIPAIYVDQLIASFTEALDNG